MTSSELASFFRVYNFFRGSEAKENEVESFIYVSEDTPKQTEGPYFIDNMPNRSDTRSDPSDGSVQEGIPLNPVIHVYSEDDTGICSNLKEACVDNWHANSEGVYSAVSDQGTTNMDLQI